jgi:hypothetical protein
MAILGPIIKRALTLGNRLETRLAISPIQQQERSLKRLLRKASQTSFGQYYNFRELLKSPDPVGAFQNQVPLHDYALMHDRWWHMTLNNMENVTWRGKVNYFALSSGTTGAPSKYIPVTEDMLRAMRRAAFRLFISMARHDVHPDLFTKAMFMLGGSTDLKEQQGHFAGDLSGINGSKIPFWLRPYHKPGSHITRINDWNERIEQVARNARDWDVGFMVGIPAWIQLALERIIEYHQVDTIHDIWPNLRVYVHGGVHLGPYKRVFDRLTRHPLTFVDTYLASEGFIAFQDRKETHAMRLLLNNGIFFEFIPFNEEHYDENGEVKPNVPCLSIGEIEEGVDYALVISTCAGAWRYQIGDTVRFTNLERSEILITGRTKHFLSICGEHLSVDNMNQGIEYVEEKLHASIPEFTVCAVRSQNFFAHKWYLGSEKRLDPKKVKELLDRRLREVNADYDTERNSVLDLQVEVVPLQLFYAWQEKNGKIGGQNKFPRVMKKEPFSAWASYVRDQLEN